MYVYSLVLPYSFHFQRECDSHGAIQTDGQPLILQCSVTTIRDINSRVDFVWISNGTELKKVGRGQ